MMNCEKHLTITITNIILFSVILATAGCSKENSKKDFIARVNETYLTREDFASLVDTTNLNPEQKDRLIKEWVYNEILFQQAVKDGITDEDEFKKIINNSKKQLASAILMDNYSLDQESNCTDEELIGYYNKNKNYFVSNANAYLLNRVYFTDEEKAIRFRNNAINSDWANAVNVFSEDSSINKSYTFALIDEYSIYPNQLNKIINDLYPQEISIVITEKPGYYSIVQMIKKISKNSILPFELIKSDVKKKLLAEKKNQIIKDYLKELYSQNEIEIKKMKIKILLLIVLTTLTLSAQQTLDKIVAVVDNEIILQSELDFQIGVYASQRQVDINTPGLKEQILNSMIEEKLIYAQADLDSITVSEDEINQRIDYQINTFTQQYGSIANIEKIYGMSIDRIKRELRDEVKKSLMSQRLQEKNFGKVEATRREVEDFYKSFKDSIGTIPEKVVIYHIFQNPKASEKLKKKFYDKAAALLDSIKAGKDFSELAKKYSDDPGSAAQGGDLGFVKKGVFYPEFEGAAFQLKVGELSGIVESPVGYHIIQMIERRGESINTRHILVKIKADENADLQSIDFLSEVRDSLQKGLGTFQYYAKKYSEDKDTSPFGGELGTFYISQLDKSLLDAVGKLKEGEIGFPKRLEYAPGTYGYHIVWLKSRVAQHKASLDSDYTEIKKLADDYKKQKEYLKWIDKIKSKIFWEVRS